MNAALTEAREALFQSAFAEFVAVRKRLASELKAAGDKEGAALLAKLARPPVSAWAVNQLWWREREAFEALIGAASDVKSGARDAGKRHRDALAALRQKAAMILVEAGNAASETTLRRITATLSAVAASGGFEPDPPGALVADRDPPGFETFVSAATSPARDESPSKAEREAAAAAKRAEEAERERRAAERERLSSELREAKQRKAAQLRDVERLRGELESAEQSLKQNQELLARLEEELASL